MFNELFYRNDSVLENLCKINDSMDDYRQTLTAPLRPQETRY